MYFIHNDPDRERCPFLKYSKPAFVCFGESINPFFLHFEMNSFVTPKGKVITYLAFRLHPFFLVFFTDTLKLSLCLQDI